MSFALTWLPEVLLEAGLKVAEQPGWRDRGRDQMGKVEGVMCHFTNGPAQGNMPTLGVLVEGRSDLPGPLSQLGLGRDGTFYVIAAGKCNHAGTGKWEGFATGNTSFIGIEAENTGTGEPWPDVQMDAYRRGVAAILKFAKLPAIRCCGHREYATPAGRKDDPNFDMNAFRRDVDAIMMGRGVVRPIIPKRDDTGRPTQRRGSVGFLVRQIQVQLGEVADGLFGPATEAAVRRYQRASDLVPDGIVGPKTWAALDRDALTARREAPSADLQTLLSIAGQSQIARYDWNNRGRAPIGYVKGMAIMFARLHARLASGDPIAKAIAAKAGASAKDALGWYADVFRSVGMSNDVDGPDTLRHVFVLLLGLGMRESSGRFCEGRDLSADNTSAETAEAGMFQTSFDLNRADPLLTTIFTAYRRMPPQLKEIFAEGVRPKPQELQNFGDGDGRDFQDLCKSSPAFAVELAAFGLRRQRKHWGPINTLAAEVRPEADALFRDIADAIDRNPDLRSAVLNGRSP